MTYKRHRNYAYLREYEGSETFLNGTMNRFDFIYDDSILIYNRLKIDREVYTTDEYLFEKIGSTLIDDLYKQIPFDFELFDITTFIQEDFDFAKVKIVIEARARPKEN